MTPSKFKQIRQDLGLSQSALAETFGTTDRAVRRWESDAPDGRGPNPMAAILLLLIWNEAVGVPYVAATAKKAEEVSDD